MTKLEQAARALLAHWDTPAWKYLKPTGDLIADLREALDHSGEANEMVEFFSKEMKNKISVARAQEQAEQEPVCCETYGCAKPCPKYYAAPVRTKDLTDDEIWEIVDNTRPLKTMDVFRAVIAADREKNRG